MNKSKITIIGAGSIGGGYYQIFGEFLGYEALNLCSRSMESITNLPGVNKFLTVDLSSAIDGVEIIIIAVKPQDFKTLVGQLNEIDLSNMLVVSAMAGISLDKLKQALNHEKIIRVMPTVAIKYGKGVTGWIGSEDVQIGDFESIFSHTGAMIKLEKESHIDAVITTSGSGTAYLLYFLEKLVDEAVKIGLDEKQANRAARMSLIGLAEQLAKEPKKSFAEVRTSITSKKGITEAALESMQESGLDDLVHEAIEAACQRSNELDVYTNL